MINESIDLSGEFIPIKVGELKPSLTTPKTNKIALIDADTLVYATCSKHQYLANLDLKGEIGDREWVEEYAIDIKLAYQNIEEKLSSILEITGCSDYELHFTLGKSSFRYKLTDDYKANRESSKSPAGLEELKKYIKEKVKDKAFIHTKYEADDMVVFLKNMYPSRYVLCSVDKDVLYSLEGKHFNIYSREDFNIPMKWVEVDKLTALKHHYKQCLIGDRQDNIKGVHGIGKVKADKILENCTTKKDCYTATLEAYKSVGLTAKDLQLTMRLVNMHQLKIDVNLWR